MATGTTMRGEPGALTLFGLLPEPEMESPEPAEAWLAALGRKAGAAAEARARSLRAAGLAGHSEFEAAEYEEWLDWLETEDMGPVPAGHGLEG